jgi:hypothetical protein
MTFLALAVGLVSLRVLTFDPMVIDEVLRPNLIDLSGVLAGTSVSSTAHPSAVTFWRR